MGDRAGKGRWVGMEELKLLSGWLVSCLTFQVLLNTR